MQPETPLYPDSTYHIYNRGNNGEALFREARNYEHFLNLYVKYADPVLLTFAWCLLGNHFHWLVRVRNEPHITPAHVSRALSNMFNAYTKAINKAYGRTGSLFEKRFHRRLIENDADFITLVGYIHRNPQRHRLIDDFRAWRWSSYKAIISDRPTRVQRDEVLTIFGGVEAFVAAHEAPPEDLPGFQNLAGLDSLEETP